MSEQPSAQPPTPTPPPDTASDDGGLMRGVYIAVGVFAGIMLLIFAIAVGLSVAFGDQQFGEVIAIIRDVMFIFLALEGILIVLALAVLIAQLARLVNLVQNEIKPILSNTQETVQHAKGTVEFVSKNVTEPVISVNAFLSAAGVFARELFRLNRALSKNPSQSEESTDDSVNEAEADDRATDE